jgi:hypothetical protein
VIGRSLVLLLAAACGGGGGFPDAPGVPDSAPPGTFRLQWSIKTSGGADATCTDAGATSVVTSLHDHNTGNYFGASFVCAAGSGISGSLPIGTYDITFALNSDTATIAMAMPQMGIVIVSKQTTPVAPIVFTLN